MTLFKLLSTREELEDCKIRSTLEKYSVNVLSLPTCKTSHMEPDFTTGSYDYTIVSSPKTAKLLPKGIQYGEFIVAGRSTAKSIIDEFDIEPIVPDTPGVKGISEVVAQLDDGKNSFLIAGAKHPTLSPDQYITRSDFKYLTLYVTDYFIYSDGYVDSILARHGMPEVLFMSPSACRGFCKNSIARPDCIVVGKSTAKEAEENGFNLLYVCTALDPTKELAEYYRKRLQSSKC